MMVVIQPLFNQGCIEILSDKGRRPIENCWSHRPLTLFKTTIENRKVLEENQTALIQ